LLVLKVQSPLADGLEQLAHDVIGCCVEVHRELEPGVIEGIYARAVAMEMTTRGISFEAEKPIPVHYRGALLVDRPR
jgi:GxxExxY protein